MSIVMQMPPGAAVEAACEGLDSAEEDDGVIGSGHSGGSGGGGGEESPVSLHVIGEGYDDVRLLATSSSATTLKAAWSLSLCR